MNQTKRLVILGLFLSIVFSASIGHAAVPNLINYQGRLTDAQGQPLADGSYNINFKIYDQLENGAPLWTEEQTVTLTNGIFSTTLGKNVTLDEAFDVPYFLEIVIDGQPLTPRQQITSSAYAMRAKTADLVVQAENATNATNAENANNADTVDTFHASATPTANNLLVADSNGKLPVAALKVYDSGWRSANPNDTFTLSHNLGTDRILVLPYWRNPTNGANYATCVPQPRHDGSADGIMVGKITTTQLTLRIVNTPRYFRDDGVLSANTYGGEYKIIAIALE